MRIIHYQQGYKIVINNKFYEVSDGKTITHFGELRHKPTLQELFAYKIERWGGTA